MIFYYLAGGRIVSPGKKPWRRQQGADGRSDRGRNMERICGEIGFGQRTTSKAIKNGRDPKLMRSFYRKREEGTE